MQPFVENAIWHGLIPSKREKELCIRILNQGSDVLIEILDNGIGYFRSIAGKSELDSHRSHGIVITEERIAQFNQKNGPQITVGIEERLDTQGTRVRICVEMC